MEHIALILADRSPLVASGFIRCLQDYPSVEIAGEVSTLADLHRVLIGKDESVTIVDWHMVTLEDVKQLARKTKLILSSMPEDTGDRREALRAGARGFIGKYQSSGEIQKAIQAVASGHIAIGRTTAEAILNDELVRCKSRTAVADGIDRLTARERQVIQAICEGLDSRRIALELHIAAPTLAHHLTSIFSKLGVKDRSSLIVFAFKHALATAPTGRGERGRPGLVHGGLARFVTSDDADITASGRRAGDRRKVNDRRNLPRFPGTPAPQA
jgi:DNA-binding NarL/FixJ family response regulator